VARQVSSATAFPVTFHDEEEVAVRLPPTAWRWIRQWLPHMVPESGRPYAEFSSSDIACISYAMGMFWYAIGDQVRVGEEVVKIGDRGVWTLHMPLSRAPLTDTLDDALADLKREVESGTTTEVLRIQAMAVMAHVGCHLAKRMGVPET
jgi:hypothetical protein